MQLPFTRNVPESFDEKDTTVEKTQSLTMGDEEESVVQHAPLSLPDENSRLQTAPDPVQGETSLSGNGSERVLSMANMDQSGIDLTRNRQQSKSNNTLFRSSLIGLMLAGLAFGFFFGLMPWIKKRREQ